MTKRIDRLVHVKQRVVDGASLSLLAGQQRTAAAERDLEATKAALAAALERGARASSVADLIDADAHACTLQKAIQRAATSLSARQMEEGRLRAAVSDARTELRRFELWGERVAANETSVAERLARTAEDDHTARSRRRA